MKKTVKALLRKAYSVHDPNDAVKFSQAAINVAVAHEVMSRVSRVA